MADLVTRILLDNKNFDDNIAKSKQQVKDLDNITTTISGSIKNLAGMFGLAMGAAEVFNRTIDATQTTADAMARVTEQASAGVDTFFNALSRGDFSNFLNGLQNSINKAGKLADVLDELDSKKLFNDIELNDLETKKTKYMNLARDKSLSDADRNKYLKLAEQTDEKIRGRKQDLASSNNAAYYAGMRSIFAKGGYTGKVSNQLIDYLMKGSTKDTRDKEYEKYQERNKYYNTEKNKHVTYTEGRNGSQIAHYDKEWHNLDAQQKKYNSSSFGKLIEVIMNTNESVFEKITGYKKTANQFISDISNSTMESHNVGAKINGSYNTQHKGTSSSKKEETFDNTKIGHLEKQISELSKKISSTKDTKTKEELNTKLKTLEQDKLKIVFEDGTIEEINKQISEYQKKLNTSTTNAGRQGFSSVIKELEERKIRLQFVAEYGNIKDVKEQKINGAINSKSSGTDFTQFNKIDTSNFKPLIKKEDVDNTKDYMDNLVGMSNILTNITRQTDKSAAAWLSWGANTLAATATVIPQVLTLIGLKKVDAAVSKEGAVANAAKSAAETPVVGWILALSAVAALTASMLSIPKFETGGIVPGTSMIGDKVLARVNSGEMILNRSQQTNLFNLLNNGVTTNNTSTSEIKLRVQGTDLIGVLKNYNNKYNKLR